MSPDSNSDFIHYVNSLSDDDIEFLKLKDELFIITLKIYRKHCGMKAFFLIDQQTFQPRIVYAQDNSS